MSQFNNTIPLYCSVQIIIIIPVINQFVALKCQFLIYPWRSKNWKITSQILRWIKENIYTRKWKFGTFWDANDPQSTCCTFGVEFRLWIWTKLDGSVVVLHLLFCMEPAMEKVFRLIWSNNRYTIYNKTFIYIIHTLLCSTMQSLISSITGCFLQILLFMSNIKNQF